MTSVFDDYSQEPDWAKDVVSATNVDAPPQEPTEEPAAAQRVAQEAQGEPQGEPEPPSEGEVRGEPQGETPEGETPQEAQKEVPWEKRYSDLFRHYQTRMNEMRAIEEQNAKLQAALEKVVPLIRQMAAPDHLPEEELQRQGIDPEVYKAVKPVIDREVDARLKAIQAQTEAERQAAEIRRMEEEIASTVASFMEERQIEQGSELDLALGTFIQELQAASDAIGLPPLDLRDRSLYDIALEAAKSPALRDILLANPRYIDDDRYVELARRQAALIEGVRPVTTQDKQPLPHVARGGGRGNPQGTPRNDDPLADVKALVAGESSGVF